MKRSRHTACADYFMDAPILRFDRHSPPGPHIPSSGPEVSLEITRGRVRQRVRKVPGRVFLIGAAADCDLVLGDWQFPEAYAYLFAQDGRVTIRRLGSGPELRVSGEAVESAELFSGDVVAFGPFELKVRIGRLVPPGDDPAGALLEELRCALSAELPPLRVFDGSGASTAELCRAAT
jgi:hypothetical protein